MSNLIEVLTLQHKYPEAETLALKLLPLLQREMGENSPQALGCMRKLMLSLVGQGKKEEARGLWPRGVELIAMMLSEEPRLCEKQQITRYAQTRSYSTPLAHPYLQHQSTRKDATKAHD